MWKLRLLHYENSYGVFILLLLLVRTPSALKKRYAANVLVLVCYSLRNTTTTTTPLGLLLYASTGTSGTIHGTYYSTVVLYLVLLLHASTGTSGTFRILVLLLFEY